MQKKSSSSVQIFYPKFNQKELIRIIEGQLEELDKKLSLRLVVLFGSYARGDFTVASDVDLLVIYKGEFREDAFNVVKKNISVLRLEPHVYSEDEYEQVKDVLNRMVENGIVLWDSKRQVDAIC